jgi:hypothetical protein
MGEITTEALHVRSLSGDIWLSVPRPAAEPLRASDLKRRLCEVLTSKAGYGITEGRLRLTIGARTVFDEFVFRSLWPKHGGDLNVQLTIRRTREDEVEQAVLTILNQNATKEAAVDELTSLEVHTSSDLSSVAQAILYRALSNPSQCNYYADIMCCLVGRYPEFPAVAEGDKPACFTRVLLKSVQNGFESWLSSMDPKDERKSYYSKDDLNLLVEKRKREGLAYMQLIGTLCVKSFVGPRVISEIMYDLIGNSSSDEYLIECACVLLRIVGNVLERSPDGKIFMANFVDRLSELKKMCSKRTKDLIQGF